MINSTNNEVLVAKNIEENDNLMPELSTVVVVDVLCCDSNCICVPRNEQGKGKVINRKSQMCHLPWISFIKVLIDLTTTQHKWRYNDQRQHQLTNFGEVEANLKI